MSSRWSLTIFYSWATSHTTATGLETWWTLLLCYSITKELGIPMVNSIMQETGPAGASLQICQRSSRLQKASKNLIVFYWNYQNNYSKIVLYNHDNSNCNIFFADPFWVDIEAAKLSIFILDTFQHDWAYPNSKEFQKISKWFFKTVLNLMKLYSMVSVS